MSHRVVANSALNAAAGLTLLLIGFICSIVTARLLGPAASGTIAFSLWLALTAALIAELGTGVTLLRLLPQLKGQNRSLAERRGFAAFMLRPVIIATLIIVAVYGGYVWMADHEHWATSAPSVAAITGLLIIVQSIGAYSKNVLLGEQEVGTFFKMSLAAGLLQLTAVVLGAVFFGIPGALLGYVFGFTLQFFYTLGLLRYRADNCGLSSRYLAGSSTILSVMYVVDSVFLNRLELLFLERFHGVEMVGYYAVALSLANLALQLPVQLTGSLLPYYSEQMQKAGHRRLPAMTFANVLRNLAYITLPLSFGLAVVAPRLVTAVFGPAFAESGTILVLLAMVAPLYVLAALCTQYLLSQDRIKARLMISVAGAVITVAGSFLLIPTWAGEGAAIVRILSLIVMIGLMFKIMEFDGSLASLGPQLLRIMGAALLTAIAAYMVLEGLTGLIGLVLAILAGIVAYPIGLRLFKAFPDSDRPVIEGLLARLPKRVSFLTGLLSRFLFAGRGL
ncbi:polysaccharide biosynthesis C-terminal domain-containing protein [Peteryoungia desertarenae]|uniref:Polysaccharide biosynthesis C-terminal domain-containing protein n=1 Tax=Peteryoungia desertarenae TaxID=1813451 RepID=A0ABX6QI17_9HYPH|nr:polysaccharide biosynthesis C-terminal domain-containing protein [Peteryoungia desertarenae]QLF68208.1 polysaccharide biosynthesis C-terminal domain-containing protein [Peteryoungia desertarenae]